MMWIMQLLQSVICRRRFYFIWRGLRIQIPAAPHSDRKFLNLLYELRIAIHCVMHYYRDRVLRVLLDDGLQIDVFGDS